MSVNSDLILAYLKAKGSPEAKAGMSRFGIAVDQAFGVSIPDLRTIAKLHKKNHELAAELWASGFHEARILASMIDDPKLCTDRQMEAWVRDFNSWDLCDQTCFGLFAKTAHGWNKALEWPKREEEFVRRAGFALMAAFALQKSDIPDFHLRILLTLIEQYSTDNRNFVKKAVNWALRQIGKRNRYLHGHALTLSERLMKSPDKTARWIGKDAYKELTSENVARLIDKREGAGNRQRS
jgi:3-methyladenine DNA glycosylase AlkD